MTINIELMWKTIDKKYIGMSPNTVSVKPVHIMNGLTKTVMGEIYDTKSLNRFVFSQKADGKVIKGHELNTVYEWLEDNNKIDVHSISKEDIKKLRSISKKVVNVDKGVYNYGMDSYTGFYKGFASRDYVGQSGGEFIALWLSKIDSPLFNTIKSTLNNSNDIISSLLLPLINGEGKKVFDSEYDTPDLKLFQKNLPNELTHLWLGMEEAAKTLNLHLKKNPNKLYIARMISLFSSIIIIRHLTSLEAGFVPGKELSIPPILLDFSDSSSDPIAKASTMTYTHCAQSMTRFYTWAFSKEVSKEYSIEELLEAGPPLYNDKKNLIEVEEIWKIAKDEIRESEHPFTVVGQAIYDILALQSEDPVRYFRNLGYRSGAMWPPIQAGKRFKIQQDVLEVLIKSTVKPNEAIDMSELQKRLWDRFGMVIGGRQEDDDILLEAGIYQADTNALQNNKENFSTRLSNLDFARLLADGVLQIGTEESHA